MVVLGTGEGRELVLKGTQLQFGDMEGSGHGWWGQLHSHVSVLNATEPHTSTCLVLCCVYFIIKQNSKALPDIHLNV
jgi:hypothetical protein